MGFVDWRLIATIRLSWLVWHDRLPKRQSCTEKPSACIAVAKFRWDDCSSAYSWLSLLVINCALCQYRMVMGMYTVGDNQLISSTISPPIRVLANNDVPSGAAYIPFTFMAPSSWDGWRMDMHPRLPDSIRSSSGWDPEFNRSLSYRSSDRRSGKLVRSGMHSLLLYRLENLITKTYLFPSSP